MTVAEEPDTVLGTLRVLRERLTQVRLPLEVSDAQEARKLRGDILAQLDDYIVPRLNEIDAPLLAVVGGSTGAGKSTLVNGIVGRAVTVTSVLRPTTRSPVLAFHPDDAEWFVGDRILPQLNRSSGERPTSPGSLHLVPDEDVPPGLALLDAPDIDSVVSENRQLAAELLAAADLWLFVTTAARYADAVPWDLLRSAAERSAAVAVVLDRVPPEAVDEVRQDLATMLDLQGLGDSPLFVVEECRLVQNGMLPPEQVEPVGNWLRSLAADAEARVDVVRRTLDGAVADVLRRAPMLADAADEQAQVATRLRTTAQDAYEQALTAVDQASGDGTLLRGEVLARWQDFIGTGDFFRSVEQQVGRVRDRVSAFLGGRPQPGDEVEAAIGHGLQALLVDEADKAAEKADASWRSEPAGRALLGNDDLSRSSHGLDDRAAEQVRQWQAAVLDLVRTEGQDKRLTARVLSFGVNGLALALMIVVFASTAGLTGAEVGIAGGAAVVGQRLLEAIFGDQAVRRLAENARQDLRRRTEELMSAEASRYTTRVNTLAVDQLVGAALRESVAHVEWARRRETRT